jgi:hypothetical protein
MKTKSLTLIYSASALVFILATQNWLTISSVVEAQTECVNPPTESATSGATWAAGSTVNVYISSEDFPTAAEQQAVKDAFLNWQAAGSSNSGNCSGVKFNFTVMSKANMPQDSGFRVHRGNAPT